MNHQHDDVREPLDPDLAERVGGLPRAVEPERDLWPGIAARLERPAAPPEPVRWWRRGRQRTGGGTPGGARHPWRLGQLAAAAVLLAVLAGTGFGLLRVIGPGGPEGTGSPATAAGGPAIGAATPEAAPVEPVAADAAAVPGADTFGNRLMAALERKRNQLGPATSDAVEADIARLGLAMAEILTAIAEHPDDPALYHHLAARQRQEADLLLRLDQL